MPLRSISSPFVLKVMSVSGDKPKGSEKVTGFDPAYAYRLTPPASPIGSCVSRRLSGPRSYDLPDSPLVFSFVGLSDTISDA